MLTRVSYHSEIHLSPLYTFLLEPSYVTASQAQPCFVTILHFVGYVLSQIDSEQKLSAKNSIMQGLPVRTLRWQHLIALKYAAIIDNTKNHCYCVCADWLASRI